MVERYSDLNHALVEGLGPAMNPAPDLFEDIVGGVVAALVDEVDAVLEIGGHEAIVAQSRGRDALKTAGRMPALRMRASAGADSTCRRYEKPN